jgi:hypothetical protein
MVHREETAENIIAGFLLRWMYFPIYHCASHREEEQESKLWVRRNSAFARFASSSNDPLAEWGLILCERFSV